MLIDLPIAILYFLARKITTEDAESTEKILFSRQSTPTVLVVVRM
jgi:hypothetical protein